MKLVQLSVKFGADCLKVIKIELAFIFAANIKVQADRQTREIATEGHSFLHGSAGNHQAGTGDHALAMALKDAAVDSRGSTQIVRVKDDKSVRAALSIDCRFQFPILPLAAERNEERRIEVLS